MSSKAPFVEAMNSQPEQLTLAHSTLLRGLDEARLAEWRPGETAAAVAMGASSHSANALVAVLAAAGFRAVNITASELTLAADGFQPADHYVIVSESGRSPEPIEAARRLTTGRRIGISNFPDAQLGEVVDVRLGLGGFPDSPVYTVGYTATLLAYALLLDRVGVVSAGEDVARVPSIVGDALARYATAAELVGGIVAGSSAVDVIGRGTSFASAAQTALMFREGLRIPSSAYETFQYLHGPMESAKAGTTLVIFGDGRELTVAGSVIDAGVKVVLVTAAAEEDIPAAGHENLIVVPIDPALGGFVRPIVEVVFAQQVLARANEHLPFPIEEFVYHQDDTKLKDALDA